VRSSGMTTHRQALKSVSAPQGKLDRALEFTA
jgi:hypothetical protein